MPNDLVTVGYFEILPSFFPMLSWWLVSDACRYGLLRSDNICILGISENLVRVWLGMNLRFS